MNPEDILMFKKSEHALNKGLTLILTGGIKIGDEQDMKENAKLVHPIETLRRLYMAQNAIEQAINHHFHKLAQDNSTEDTAKTLAAVRAQANLMCQESLQRVEYDFKQD